MKIAITLLTCGRVDYTRRTLESLLAKNPTLTSDYMLIHGDDHSPSDQAQANQQLARDAGFRTMIAPPNRLGVARMTELLFAMAQSTGAELVLNLQNDWECMREIPRRDIVRIMADQNVYNIRMYGILKSAHGRCGIHHGGREPRRVVQWTPYQRDFLVDVAGYESGEIHWGHPPSVTGIADAVALTKHASSESVSRIRSGDITRQTVRVHHNVFSHIGSERTQEFRA